MVFRGVWRHVLWGRRILSLIALSAWCLLWRPRMFVRLKPSGPRQYLQIVENYRENGRLRRRVIATLGRPGRHGEVSDSLLGRRCQVFGCRLSAVGEEFESHLFGDQTPKSTKCDWLTAVEEVWLRRLSACSAQAGPRRRSPTRQSRLHLRRSGYGALAKADGDGANRNPPRRTAADATPTHDRRELRAPRRAPTPHFSNGCQGE